MKDLPGNFRILCVNYVPAYVTGAAHYQISFRDVGGADYNAIVPTHAAKMHDMEAAKKLLGFERVGSPIGRYDHVLIPSHVLNNAPNWLLLLVNLFLPDED